MYSWEMPRSKEIVNTEIKHILSAALFFRAQSSGVAFKIWVTSSSTDESPNHGTVCHV